MDREASNAGVVDEANRTSRRIGAILGVGLMGSLDEIVFHQLLRWHHFYDRSGPSWDTISDGLLHAFTATMLAVGAVLLWAERRRLVRVVGNRSLVAGVLLGMGGFQLFDGVVNHKMLRLHQIREDTDNLLTYDLIWNAAAIATVGVGWALWRGRRQVDGSGDVAARGIAH